MHDDLTQSLKHLKKYNVKHIKQIIYYFHCLAMTLKFVFSIDFQVEKFIR